MIYIGTAGWSIPRAVSDRFGFAGTHLQRYARLMTCAEINSSFYRPHRQTTYARWAASTGDEFRFAVKVPKLITHERRLRDSEAPFERFLDETSGLGHRRGALLVQLPPSATFESVHASAFFEMVRQRYEGPLVCEPRHPTWFAEEANALLCEYRVGRVVADPPTTADSSNPGGWTGMTYFRLHGTPRMYWSRYDAAYIGRLAVEVKRRARAGDVWCIFDNTAMGAAIENAMELAEIS